ncbi:MAG: hypothetical protein LQ346_001854 [Caloplaca aetnensis]|nr:MAG: hypothetical protein LQ346_001854 [Caloplaca aetnensis]
MPRTTFPPTPAPSLDIVGKDSGPQVPLKGKASFTLPPPAINPSLGHDDPVEEGTKYSLPPPPTRTRKIIQMTPKMDPKRDKVESTSAAAPVTTRQAASGSPTATRKATGKKQPSSTSQAGKKMARKTAHSVIERRRRSKMNEEFGVLKHMIPACQNQDMHKLAILQASIEYLRYLEQCVTDLKAANGLKSGPTIHRPPPIFQQSTDDDEEDEGDSDVEMTGRSELPLTDTDNPQQKLTHTSPQSRMTSPALDAMYCKPTSCTSSLSDLTSPPFGSLKSTSYRSFPQSTSSASTSPALVPSKEADEEATAALLMLNKDRRNTNTSSSSSSHGRGMSVKDLLSS